MEYYFYVILIFAIVLKLTVYLCWYQVRRSSATRQVRIILPDGTTQCAVITARGRSQQSHRSGEERQNLPQADLLSPYDNQGLVESAVQPRYTDYQNPQGQFQGPPPYANQEWKLPKYEEVVGMPPPYATEVPEMASAVMPGDANPPTSQSQVQPMAPTTNPAQVPVPVPAYSGQQMPYDAPPYSPPMTSVTPRLQPGISPNNVTDGRSAPAYFPSPTGQS
ncbi:extensin-like [Asterias rubens]|uniref:extensin-like n=1 Tax=Asterias rubens TaxID=7604 RepID=UPI0014559D22|nr:extensin-like [Asterias rubens]